MTILVTGGHGFLGQVLIKRLEAVGYKTMALGSSQCDLSEPKSVEYLLSLDVHFVFHLAGKTGILASFNQPALFYRSNVDTTRHVLECCRIKKIPMHYVSAYIYGNQGMRLISEDIPPEPNNPYAHSKWMGEEMCRFYANKFSIPVTISRPFNVYGPKQSSDFFIPRMINQLQNCDEVRLQDLHPKRDYVFVEDVADALIAIMKRGESGHSYNIGTGKVFSCEEVVSELQSILRTRKVVVSEHRTRAEEIAHTQANIDKISKLDWFPSHTLREGLVKCF